MKIAGLVLIFLVAPALAGCQAPTTAPVPTHDELGSRPDRLSFANPVAIMPQGSGVESSLIISPKNPELLFACTMFNLVAGTPGFHFFVSRDAGSTWSQLPVESQPADPRGPASAAGDCDVAADAAGTLYAAKMWIGSVSVGASQDEGRTWTTGSLAAGSSPNVDRPWIVGGGTGVVHLAYHTWQTNDRIWYSRSTDYAASFRPAVPAAAGDVWVGGLAASLDGQGVYVSFRQAGRNVALASSHDGGMVWKTSVVSARDVPVFFPPNIARTQDGRLGIAWAEGKIGNQSVLVTRSDDDGRTWSPPQTLYAAPIAQATWIEPFDDGFLVTWYGTAPDRDNRWFIGWALLDDEGGVRNGTTTSDPVFVGAPFVYPNPRGDASHVYPEFNMARVDPGGRVRLVASVPIREDATAREFRLIFQAGTIALATPPPATGGPG